MNSSPNTSQTQSQGADKVGIVERKDTAKKTTDATIVASNEASIPSRKKKSRREVGDWIERVDKKGRRFYVNKKTKVSQWDPPEGFLAALVQQQNGETQKDAQGQDKKMPFEYNQDVVRSGHVERKTNTGVWRTEFINLTENVLCLSPDAKWDNADNVICVPLLNVKSVDSLARAENNPCFTIKFNPHGCVGLAPNCRQLLLKAKSEGDAMDWVTEVDRQAENAQDTYALSSRNDETTGKEIQATPMSHSDLLVFMEDEGIILNQYPTDEDLFALERQIEQLEDRKYRLIKQTMWLEWRENHNLPRFLPGSLDSPRGEEQRKDNDDTSKDNTMGDLVKRRMMLSQYSLLIGVLRTEPDLLGAIGSSLPEKAQDEFAQLLVYHLYAASGVHDNAGLLEGVIEATARQHSEAQVFLGDHNNIEPNRLIDNFLSCMLKYHARRPEHMAFAHSIIDDVEWDSLKDTLSSTQLFELSAMYSPRRASDPRLVAPGLREAVQLVEKLCNTATKDSISVPRSIVKVCQILDDHPGPVSPKEFIFDLLLPAALEMKAKSASNQHSGKLATETLGHLRAIASLKKWDGMSLKLKASIAEYKIKISSFLKRLCSIDMTVFEKSSKSLVFGNGIQDRVVVSCFQLYLLHMALYRYSNLSHVYPHPKASVLEIMDQLGNPTPLPGTHRWGSAENPFTILVVRKPKLINDAVDFQSANYAIKRAMLYFENKSISDEAQHILSGLGATITEIQEKCNRKERLSTMLEDSKRSSAAIEGILRSPARVTPKLVETMGYASPAKVIKHIPATFSAQSSAGEGFESSFSSPLKALMNTVFSPLNLRNKMELDDDRRSPL